MGISLIESGACMSLANLRVYRSERRAAALSRKNSVLLQYKLELTQARYELQGWHICYGSGDCPEAVKPPVEAAPFLSGACEVNARIVAAPCADAEIQIASLRTLTISFSRNLRTLWRQPLLNMVRWSVRRWSANS